MRRSAASIGIAVGAHAAALAMVYAVHVRRDAPPQDAQTAEVDLESPESAPSPPAMADPAADPVRTTVPGAVAVAVAVPRSSSPAPRRDGSTPALPSASADGRSPTDPGWSAWDALTTRPAIGLTLPPPGAASESRSIPDVDPGPSPASTTGGLREGLAARDHALGLGPGGPVVGAAETATRSSTAPIEGFALFEVRFDESGAVHDVRVVDAKSERDSWSTVAGGIAAGLAATHIRVPGGAHGYSVKVRVESAWLNADGSRPGPYAVCVWPAPCKVDPKQNKIVIVPTPLMLGVGGNIPDTPVAPTRQVHARIVEEHAF